MRMILTYARAMADGFLGSGGRVSAAGLIGDAIPDQPRQRVEEIEWRVIDRAVNLAQQTAQLGTRTGQRGLAQETP
jgi:hypothetical protein